MSKRSHSLGQLGDDDLDSALARAEVLMSNHRNAQDNS